MDNITLPVSSVSNNRLEKTSFILLLLTILIAPLAFIPSAYAPLDMVKTAVITIGILVSTLLYILSCFKNRNLFIPRHHLFTISCGLIVSCIISALVSTSILKSFFGQGFEIGTVSFLLVLFLGSLLTVYTTYKDSSRTGYIYGVLAITFVVIFLFQISRLIFGVDFLSLGILNSTTSTLLGKWDDLALFAGVVGLVSYLALRLLSLRTSYKIALSILCAISTMTLVFINSATMWGVITIVLIALAVYEYSNVSSVGTGFRSVARRLPIVTMIVCLIAIIGFWKADSVVSPVLKKFNIGQSDVVLSWQSALDISVGTIKESPLFGAGPNRFGVQYLKYKPTGIISTVFWNTEFSSGFGLIPTFFTTQGIVGIILWLLLLIAFIRAGYMSLKQKKDAVSRFFTASVFFPTLLLWLSMLVYVPSHVILLVSFIMIGLFVSNLIREGQISLVQFGNKEKPILAKFIPAILIIAIIVSVLWLALYVKKVLALGYFEAGISALNQPDNKGLVAAENNFKKALALDKLDTYYQALSEVSILKINVLAQKIQAEAQKTGKVVDAEAAKAVGSIVEEAIQYTHSAINADPTNYYNYISEARISEIALSLKIPNAYESTRSAYLNALKYNPYNPAIYLNLARIDASQNKLADAQKDIGIALQIKPNYVDAIFLLSQIQVGQGQIKDAIISVQVATQINPTNPLLFFQLGLLYYNNKEYQNAVDALSQATKLDNKYANAQYFLGLSYARLGKLTDAIIQFESLAESNPDNQEVALILANLRNGKTPFADAKPPIDSKPEQRKTLPIKTR